MRSSVLLAAAVGLIGTGFIGATALPARAEPVSPAATVQAAADQAFSAQRKNKKKRARTTTGSGGQQIACTQFGCNPIPRGCRVVPGKIPFTWEPSGFDEIVCPYPR